jgi:hypothetical protein
MQPAVQDILSGGLNARNNRKSYAARSLRLTERTGRPHLDPLS